MINPNRFRSCHPRAGVSKTTPAPLGRADRDRRMTAIRDLEQNVGAFEIPELGYSTVSDHAAIHILDSNTLAVVVVCGHNARIIERAILAQCYAGVAVRIDLDIITVAI